MPAKCYRSVTILCFFVIFKTYRKVKILKGCFIVRPMRYNVL